MRLWILDWRLTRGEPKTVQRHRIHPRNRHQATCDIWGEPSPWNGGGIIPHQTYARVVCGEAAFYQRARVVMLGGTSSMFDAVVATPDFVLGGNLRPLPSEWIKFGVQSDNRMYWFRWRASHPVVDELAA